MIDGGEIAALYAADPRAFDFSGQQKEADDE